MAVSTPISFGPGLGTGAITTISTGLTLDGSGALTNNLLLGQAGGQTIIGGTAASNNLTLSSTSNVTKGFIVAQDAIAGSVGSGGTLTLNSTAHATKGFVYMGSSTGLVYDETNKRLGIGVTPSNSFHIGAVALPYVDLRSNTTTGSAGLDIRNSDASARLLIDIFGNAEGGNQFGASRNSSTRVTPLTGKLLLGTIAAADLVFGTTDVERLRITAAGALQLGASLLAANGIVACALTAVGPTGANTTVQEWMLVKGTGGANRWIPMF